MRRRSCEWHARYTSTCPKCVGRRIAQRQAVSEVSAKRRAYLDSLTRNAIAMWDDASEVCDWVAVDRGLHLVRHGSRLPADTDRADRLMILFDLLYNGDPAETHSLAGFSGSVVRAFRAGMPLVSHITQPGRD